MEEQNNTHKQEKKGTTCPLCERGLIQVEKDPITQVNRSIVCSTGHYDQASKSYVGCDFKFNLKVPLLKDFTLNIKQCRKLLDGETLTIQGKRVFLDLVNPNTVNQKGSNRMVNYYLKVENIEGEREEL